VLIVKETLWKYNLNFVKDVPTTCLNFIITIIVVYENFVPTFVRDYHFFLNACVLFNKYPHKSQDLFNIKVHAVAQLVEALRYKPEGCVFTS
jgi:hypothetical protein